MPLAHVAERLGVELPVDLYDTLGGYVFGELQRLPSVGDEAPFPGGHVRVLAMDRRRVTRVSIKSEAIEEADESDGLEAGDEVGDRAAVPVLVDAVGRATSARARRVAHPTRVRAVADPSHGRAAQRAERRGLGALAGRPRDLRGVA
jgi:hypothetical protein